jgi:tetrahydromethanopterin S-methyltransferase subunit G
VRASHGSTIAFERIDHKLDEIIARLGSLERKVAGIKLDYAALQQRLDNVDRRLDRIERRLDLVDGAAAPSL